MVAVLGALCGISFLIGVWSSLTATTVFQQIVGAMSYVNACILLIGAAIVEALSGKRERKASLEVGAVDLKEPLYPKKCPKCSKGYDRSWQQCLGCNVELIDS